MVLMASALRDTGSTRQWRVIRQRILARDNYTCQYCGADNANTVDHVIPRRLGGGDDEGNLLTACSRCNYAKGGAFFERKRTPPTPHVLSNRQNTSISYDQAELF